MSSPSSNWRHPRRFFCFCRFAHLPPLPICPVVRCGAAPFAPMRSQGVWRPPLDETDYYSSHDDSPPPSFVKGKKRRRRRRGHGGSRLGSHTTATPHQKASPTRTSTVVSKRPLPHHFE